MKNTLQKGSVRYVVFREDDIWYAAALEFNIVESGTTPQEAMFLLFEAMHGYVETAKKIHIRPHVLNQSVDKEYEQIWLSYNPDKKRSQKLQPVRRFWQEVFTTGQLALA